MALDALTTVIREKVGNDCGLNATMKFMLSETEVIYIDAKAVPNVVSNANEPADCTVKISEENINKILAGEMNPMTAFMMGKIKLEGNMGVAMNLNKILS